MMAMKANYPLLEVNLRKIQDNMHNMKSLCSQNGIHLTGVIKGCHAMDDICDLFEAEAYHSIGSSRLNQLKKVKDRGLKSQRLLLRLPMLSELEDVIAYADISLNSDKTTLIALNQAAKLKNKMHKVILMTDLGDLREGVWDKDEFVALTTFVENELDHLKLYGIGTNLGCYGSVRPTETNMTELAGIAERVEGAIGRPLDIVSGGATTSVPVIVDGKMPSKINHLRVGEGVLLARDVTNPDFGYMDNMVTDTFVLKAQVIEVEVKPSYPVGERYEDAFGNVQSYEDIGMRKRALLAVGRQDFGHHDSLEAVDEKIQIIGSSSDHLIIDITDSETDYKVGDILSFTLFYQAMLFLCLSENVTKKAIQ